MVQPSNPGHTALLLHCPLNGLSRFVFGATHRRKSRSHAFSSPGGTVSPRWLRTWTGPRRRSGLRWVLDLDGTPALHSHEIAACSATPVCFAPQARYRFYVVAQNLRLQAITMSAAEVSASGIPTSAKALPSLELTGREPIAKAPNAMPPGREWLSFACFACPPFSLCSASGGVRAVRVLLALLPTSTCPALAPRLRWLWCRSLFATEPDCRNAGGRRRRGMPLVLPGGEGTMPGGDGPASGGSSVRRRGGAALDLQAMQKATIGHENPGGSEPPTPSMSSVRRRGGTVLHSAADLQAMQKATIGHENNS